MRRDEALKKLTEEYALKREKALNEAEQREKQIRNTCPEIAELLIRRAALPAESLKRIMTNRNNAQEISEQMRIQGLKLNEDIREGLKRRGYAPDFLAVHYTCGRCRDTGYLDGVPAKMCQCLEKNISRLISGIDADTPVFESFDEASLPLAEVAPGVTQRQWMSGVKQLCLEFADTFPNPEKQNLMLTGEAGLGKSFMLNCIANRVSARGYEAKLINAYTLNETMRSRHFHQEEEMSEFDSLVSCPLLLIDDLGTEPMLRNITMEYLFILINERQSKNTVIATNMTPVQIKDRYGERIMSRLCANNWQHIRLMGKDLRRG